MRRRLSKIGKSLRIAIGWLTGLAIASLCLVIFIINIPQFQAYMVSRVVDGISLKTGYNLDIGETSIYWLDRMVLNEITLRDREDSVMLDIAKLKVNYSLFGLLEDQSINIDRVTADTILLNLRKYSMDKPLNLSGFLQSLSSDSSSTIFHVDKVSMDVVEVNYENLSLETSERASSSSFSLKAGNINTNRLNLYPGEIYISDIAATECAWMEIPFDGVVGDLVFTQTQLEFSEFEIRTPNSLLKNYLRMDFGSPSDLKNLVEDVQLDLQLRESRIQLAEFERFIKLPVAPITEAEISADISGTISRLALDNAFLILDEETRFRFKANMNGLPDIRSTFVLLEVDQSILSGRLLSENLPKGISGLTDLKFSGSFIGFINDFVSNGTFITPYGTLNSDVNLKIGSTPENTSISGKLGLDNFELGRLLQRENILGNVNFYGSLTGQGLTKNSADYVINASATKSEVLGHTYDRIELNGNIRSRYFSGDVLIADSILNVIGTTKVDFSTDTELIDVSLRIDSADLLAYGLSRERSFLSFQIDGDLQELSVNETQGLLDIENLVFQSKDYNQRVPDFQVVASTSNTNEYHLISEDFQIDLWGDFLLTQLVADIPRTLNQYREYFTSDYAKIRSSYQDTKPERDLPSQYDANLQAKFYNLKDYFQVLAIPFNHSDDFFIEANYRQRNDATLDLFVSLDTLRFGNRTYTGNTFEINASKAIDSLGVLALLQLSSREQKWDVVDQTKNLFIEGVWNNNHLDLGLQLESPNTNSSGNIRADLTLQEDTIAVQLETVELVAFDKNWDLNRQNQIWITKGSTWIKDLEFRNASQKLAISGKVSDSLSSEVIFDFRDFELENISTVIPRKFEGLLTGTGTLFRENSMQPFNFISDSRIQDLVFENVEVGNLSGSAVYDKSDGGILLDYQLEREGINTVEVDGKVNPISRNQIDLNINFDQANFNILEPFFQDMISDVNGYASGNLKVFGRFDNPGFEGTTQLTDGNVKIDYLNTTYKFSGPANFDKDLITLNNIVVADRLGNTGVITGQVRHRGFKDINLDLGFEHQNFELLNTNRGDNTLYYGTAYSSGVISFSGPVRNVVIQADAVTEPNTRIYIPFVEENEIVTGDFISFSGPEDAASKSKTETVIVRGITLDFDVEVTEDAYIELIFDPRTGDIIRGRGNGNLQLNIDPNGQFELFGTVEIRDGAYNFTTSLINKEFQIQPGGTISWFGDPYTGILNLEAYYRQLASYQDWRPTGVDGTVSNKQPVLVNLGLNDEMMNPSITFGIEMEDPNIANSDDNWRNLITTINNNPEELKRQVFSLLMLRKFSLENSFVVGISEGIGNSVSEFVSNQLSYWINQVDENLEVNIDLNTLDTDALNTFQLRLAYTFLDGRLRVTRGGGVSTVVEGEQTTGVSGVIGDWSVEYLLTEDGRFRVKAFSRNNQDALGQTTNEQEAGASIQFIRSFDDLKELIEVSRKEEETKTVSQAIPATTGNSSTNQE